MKKLIWVPFTLVVAITLLGCQQTEGVQGANSKSVKKAPSMKNKKKTENLKPKIIIRSSVEDPLPPEAKDAQSMPNKKDPQDVPNVRLDEPVVITLMPYSAQKRSTVKGTPVESDSHSGR